MTLSDRKSQVKNITGHTKNTKLKAMLHRAIFLATCNTMMGTEKH